LEIWNVELNSIGKKNRGTSSIQLNILILQLTVLHAHSPPPTHSKTEKERILGRDRYRWGRGSARSRILRAQESLVLYKSFNTLCMVSCMRDINVGA
jgi:hypothetical protein